MNMKMVQPEEQHTSTEKQKGGCWTGMTLRNGMPAGSHSQAVLQHTPTLEFAPRRQQLTFPRSHTDWQA